MLFKDRIRQLRKENNLTQTQLANVLNYGCTAISNYESGKNQPSISDLIKIADFFNVSLDYLLGTSDIKTPLSVYNSDPYAKELLAIFTDLDEQQKLNILSYSKWVANDSVSSLPKVAEKRKPYLTN